MSDDGPDVSAEDALQIAQRALGKVNDQERRIDGLEEDLTALQLRYSEVEEDRDYNPDDLNGNIGRVREHAFEKACSNGGKTTLDYDDVMWEVFGGDPSADYCYKLMRLAADVRGFTFEDSRPKQLKVNAAEAKRSAAFSSAKKTVSEGMGR